MQRPFSIYIAAAFLLVIGFSQTLAAAVPESASTGIADQESVSVTVYNVNLGLVKDVRHVKLGEGTFDLRFMDVASSIIPASVHIMSLSDPESISILEQNYEYDLLSPAKLMDKYVGKRVKLYTVNSVTEREETLDAVLLSNNDGPVYRIGDDITFGYPGRVIFPEVPDDLISRPTLIWLLENRLLSPQRLEVSYLTDGITWSADYVMTLQKDDAAADLSGWVTIDNKSGGTFINASLKLVAGDVRRVAEQPVMYLEKQRTMMAGAPQFREEGFFEYHIYTMERPTTIKNNQTKQISLLDAGPVPVRKELAVEGQQNYYLSAMPGTQQKQKVGVYMELVNSKENGLGMPLPKGVVRMYKRDNDGALQFIGEDSIDHTPRDEKLRLKAGEAFDVVAERRQTDWKKRAYDTYESAFEIVLRNHKEEDVVVRVIEPVPGDWKMLESSRKHEKTGAHKAEFLVSVPKGGQTALTYRVQTRY